MFLFRKFLWDTFDFSPLLSLLESEGLPAVVNYLDVYLTQSRLSTEYKETLLQQFEQQISWTLESNFDGDENARNANLCDLLGAMAYQIILTPEFAVQH